MAHRRVLTQDNLFCRIQLFYYLLDDIQFRTYTIYRLIFSSPVFAEYVC